MNRYLGRPVEEHHRDEHDADRQRRDERRPGDLHGPVEDRLPQRLAQAEVAVDVFDLHRRVVDQDADRQRQAAERHHVERVAQRDTASTIDDRIASGIDTATISVLRQLPRNSRIIAAVSRPAMMLSVHHAFDGRRDEQRLIEQQVDLAVPSARRPGSRGSIALTWLTMSSVEALPFLSSVTRRRACRCGGRSSFAWCSRRGPGPRRCM